MKNCKPLLAVCATLAALTACSPKASIDMTVKDAPGTKLAVHKLNVNTTELLDSVCTDAKGHFRYSVDVKKGDPDFIYVFKGDTRLASLLLEAGEKAVVEADTLGSYSVSGSKGSEELCEVEKDYAEFISAMKTAPDTPSFSKTYINYYRSRVSYVMGHSSSLSVIPVLYQTLAPGVPVFSQATDAITFRAICDSLKMAYPDSRYVKALERETQRRENALGLQVTLSQAEEAGFPELCLPDVNSEKVSLAGVDAKAILVHFWTADDAAQKLFNQEVLMPLYTKYHPKGLEIYSVCLSTDKALWASVVRNQKLPWINVCDGLGSACPALGYYNIQTLPSTVLIADGEVSTTNITGEQALRKELSKLLK